jgi:hypothetical protein
MLAMKFSDIVLTDDELDSIQVELEALNQTYEAAHGFAMSKGEKTLTRQRLIRDFKEGVWANRDYVYGQDEGEPPKGAEW